MLPEDRVGIVQYQALCRLDDASPIGMSLGSWRRAINAITIYGQAPVVAQSLIDRGMVKMSCIRSQHTNHDVCLVAITDAGASAKLRRGMVKRLVSRA